MHAKIISFLKNNPLVLRACWNIARLVLRLLSLLIHVKKKQMLFASFGGRKFDDSPKAIYDEVCKRNEFDDWNLIWAFVSPEKIEIPRGKKIRMDSRAFFKALLQSQVWVSNSGMDRDIFLNLENVLKVETWHGTPLKKICGDEHSNIMGGKREWNGDIDAKTIRCAQSEFDRELFQRLFHASKESFMMCDLPRNDKLLRYKDDEIIKIKISLGIPLKKKVVLYAPTYREYLWDNEGQNLLAPPVDLSKWKNLLFDEYVLLFRAHYAVGTALNIKTDDFVKDVSAYHTLNDLYIVSDIMISDYSSCYFDYSILNRPMLNFSYDLEEYEAKRGLYLNLENTLPCKINRDEDSLLDEIINLDYGDASAKTRMFHEKYAPYAGHASEAMVDEIYKRISI